MGRKRFWRIVTTGDGITTAAFNADWDANATKWLKTCGSNSAGPMCSQCAARVTQVLTVHCAKMLSLLEGNGHDPVIGALTRKWREAYIGRGHYGAPGAIREGRVKVAAGLLDTAEERWKAITHAVYATPRADWQREAIADACWGVIEMNTARSRVSWVMWLRQMTLWLEDPTFGQEGDWARRPPRLEVDIMSVDPLVYFDAANPLGYEDCTSLEATHVGYFSRLRSLRCDS